MSEQSEEERKVEMASKCLQTLDDNSASYVMMLQVDGQWPGELYYGGNFEAAKAMAQRCWDEFHSQYLESTVVCEIDEEDEF